MTAHFNPDGPEWRAALAGVDEYIERMRGRRTDAAHEVAELEAAVYGTTPADQSDE
ncbi:hypothetical protein ACGF07_25390 [Kitasatospora sp. NPDC048194]|uniref:hypothetical protein n=1 Tax=Kitasatospora sp. NPDC048194 TaxID=3364045 RepID=UPI00371ADB26